MSMYYVCVFFFNDTATTEIYTLSLHDALPILPGRARTVTESSPLAPVGWGGTSTSVWGSPVPSTARTFSRSSRSPPAGTSRSEEHTFELQSRQYLVCRLLLEKKKQI